MKTMELAYVPVSKTQTVVHGDMMRSNSPRGQPMSILLVIT